MRRLRQAKTLEDNRHNWQRLTEHVRRTVSESALARDEDDLLYVDATADDVVITLPAPKTLVGPQLTIMRIDNSMKTLTIQPAGSGTINGSPSITLTTQWEAAVLTPLNDADWTRR